MSEQSTFWSEELLAKTSLLRVSEQEWTEIVVNSQLSSLDLLKDYGPDGWSGRTYPASCRLTEEERLEPFSESWGNSGMGSLTGFSTLNTLEYHSAAVASSLSDILETGVLAQRYYLSSTACRGILRRAKKRGKALPVALKEALESVAGPILQTETGEDSLTLQEPSNEDSEIDELESTEQGNLFLIGPQK
jgi:hypothetical protein